MCQIPWRFRSPGLRLRPIIALLVNWRRDARCVRLIVIHPGVQFKPVETNALPANGDLSEKGLTSVLKRLRSMPR